VRHHFLRELLERNVLNFKYVPIDQMFSDILTKALCKLKHVLFRDKLNVKCVTDA